MILDMSKTREKKSSSIERQQVKSESSSESSENNELRLQATKSESALESNTRDRSQQVSRSSKSPVPRLLNKIKKEPGEEMKSFAQSTMNELLGLYGYEHVAESDLSRIRATSSMCSPRSNHSSSGNSEGCLSPNSKHASESYQRRCESRNSHTSSRPPSSCDSSDKINKVMKRDQFKTKEDILKCFTPSLLQNGIIASAMRDIIRSPPSLSVSTKTNTKSGSFDDEITCAWCRKTGNCAFTLQESDGTKRFCSEKCFAACRRANFKRSRVCDWCKQVRYVCEYLESCHGDGRLQFCSTECLEKYKLNVFCNEIHNSKAEEARENKSTSPSSTSDIPSSSKHNDVGLMDLRNQRDAINGFKPTSMQDDLSKKKPRLQKETVSKSKHNQKPHSSKHYSGRDLSMFEEHSRNKTRDLYSHRNVSSQAMQYSPRDDSSSNSKSSYSKEGRKTADSVRTSWPPIMKEKAQNSTNQSSKGFPSFPAANSAQIPSFPGFLNGIGTYPNLTPHLMQNLSDFVPNPLLANPALFPGFCGSSMLPNPATLTATSEVQDFEKVDSSSFMLGMLAAGMKCDSNSKPTEANKLAQQKELPQNIAAILNAITASQACKPTSKISPQQDFNNQNKNISMQNNEKKAPVQQISPKPTGMGVPEKSRQAQFGWPAPMLLMPFPLPIPIPIPVPFPVPSETLRAFKDELKTKEVKSGIHNDSNTQPVIEENGSCSNNVNPEVSVYSDISDMNDKIQGKSTPNCNANLLNEKQDKAVYKTPSNNASADEVESSMAIDLSAKSRGSSVEEGSRKRSFSCEDEPTPDENSVNPSRHYLHVECKKTKLAT